MEPRFGALREALSAYASDPDDPIPVPADLVQAAVSLVVRSRDGLEVLLIKRAKHDEDPWSGHMAMPGGRRSEGDPSLLHTAMRETQEETGVRLRERGVHLGRLEDVLPLSPSLPHMSITPHVFGVPADTPALVASAEVEAVHWVSLDLLRYPGTRSQVEIPLPGGSRNFPCLRVVNDIVWGLTYQILDDFLLRAPEVFPLPRGD